MNGEALTATLIAIIILLLGAHYGSLIYRLHMAERELDEMRKDFAKTAIAAANAAVVAAQAIASAANAAVNATAGRAK